MKKIERNGSLLSSRVFIFTLKNKEKTIILNPISMGIMHGYLLVCLCVCARCALYIYSAVKLTYQSICHMQYKMHYVFIIFIWIFIHSILKYWYANCEKRIEHETHYLSMELDNAFFVRSQSFYLMPSKFKCIFSSLHSVTAVLSILLCAKCWQITSGIIEKEIKELFYRLDAGEGFIFRNFRLSIELIHRTKY